LILGVLLFLLSHKKMQLFYHPQDHLAGVFNQGIRLITLNAEESQHAVKVLRLKNGAMMRITDGQGNFANALLYEANAKACVVQLMEIETVAKPCFYLHLAVAPTKNPARFEWFLEKATEFGIAEITPVICDHSERQVIRTDRLNKVLISAMKQSLHAYLPRINEPEKLDKLISEHATETNRFIAWVDNTPRPHLKEVCVPNSPALILIGPEGDFSEREIELALAAGFKPVSLGKNRLRTETAALASCFIVNLLNE